MSDEVEITIRVNDRTEQGFRDVNGRLRDMRGRFVSESAAMSRSADSFAGAAGRMAGSILPIATAAVPAAAALVPLAAASAAAGAGLAAFGAAAAGQVGPLSDAAKAQQKLKDAVALSGAHSKQAVVAEQKYQQTLAKMPPATREASAGFSALSDAYRGWSDSLAGDTMPVFTKGMAVASALLPKFTGLVKGSSTELNRLVTAAAGAVAAPGFDGLMSKFTDFANRSLKQATDGIMHFSRLLSEGKANGPVSEFMRYAREQGPAVRETLANLAKAVVHLLQASAQAGPGMLTLVNAAAKLAAAVPAELLTRMMQLAVALRVVSLTGAGFALLSDAVGRAATRIAAFRAAAAAAGGGFRGAAAAMSGMHRAALGLGVLTLVGVGIDKLADKARGAPPDVDKLTTSLKTLADTGKFTGELSKTFGDVNGLVQKIGSLHKQADAMNKTAFGFRIPGLDDLADHLAGNINDMSKGSESLNALKADFGGLDQALAGLVSGGHADVAAKDFEKIKTAAVAQGYSIKDVTDLLPGYQSAVADAAFEAKLTADAQGLFGQQALKTQAALEAQKASADGLRQSIEALNDVNRAALGGMIGFEQAIDDVAKAAKVDAGALRMSHGQLDLNGAKARDAASKLSDLASKTKDATTSALDAGKSWSDVAAIYDRGREKFLAAAHTMGLTRAQAKALADQIMKTPDKTAYLKGNIGDLQKKVDAAKAKLKTVPPSKQASIRAEIRDLEAKIAKAKRDLAAIDGSTATTHIVTFYDSHYSPATGSPFGTSAKATGGVVGAAGGGPRSNLTLVGEQGPEYVRLPYGSTVIPAGTTRSMRKDERQAAAQAQGAFGISHFGQIAGYQRNPFEKSLGAGTGIGDLVGTLNQWAATIKKATHGLAEHRLLKDLDVAGRALIHNEKAYEKVNAALDKAKEKLSSLRDAFGQLKDSVASGIVSFGNITRAAGQPGRLSVSSIRDTMTEARDKATSFANALAALKKKGLSADAIAQIAQAGIEGGGLETAGALLSGSKADIADLNRLQAQIKKAAAAAGNTTATAMYGAGIKAAEGLVKGLEKQRHNLEKIMESLAKALERAIKRAIGAKASGGVVGTAAGGGPRSALTWVGEMGPELVSIAPGSMVHTAGDSHRMTAQGGGGWGGQPIQINLSLGGQHFAELLVDPLRRTIATRGGSVQAVLGR